MSETILEKGEVPEAAALDHALHHNGYHGAASHQGTPAMPGVASGDAVERVDLPLLGMHCAACATRIEKALNKAEGVSECSVNFATSRATVHYDPQGTDTQKLRDVVKKVGYDAIVTEPQIAHSGEAARGESDVQDAEAQAREAEYREQKARFGLALALTIPVVFLAMGSHLIPALQSALNAPWRVWVELALTTPVLFWAGREFFTGAWNAARHRAADMNTLVSIGTLAAYAYSLVVTVAPQWVTSAASSAGAHGAHSAGH